MLTESILLITALHSFPSFVAPSGYLIDSVVNLFLHLFAQTCQVDYVRFSPITALHCFMPFVALSITCSFKIHLCLLSTCSYTHSSKLLCYLDLSPISVFYGILLHPAIITPPWPLFIFVVCFHPSNSSNWSFRHDFQIMKPSLSNIRKILKCRFSVSSQYFCSSCSTQNFHIHHILCPS